MSSAGFDPEHLSQFLVHKWSEVSLESKDVLNQFYCVSDGWMCPPAVLFLYQSESRDRKLPSFCVQSRLATNHQWHFIISVIIALVRKRLIKLMYLLLIKTKPNINTKWVMVSIGYLQVHTPLAFCCADRDHVENYMSDTDLKKSYELIHSHNSLMDQNHVEK